MSPEADTALGAAAAALLGARRLIIATNRGPVTFVSAADGSLRPRRGSGGLVTALSQVGRHVPVTWVAAAVDHEHAWEGMQFELVDDHPVVRETCMVCGLDRRYRAWERSWTPEAGDSRRPHGDLPTR